MSNQYHGMARELEEQRQLDDDQHTLTSDETQISYWALLENVPVPGGTPESGDKFMLEEARAEQINQCLDTQEADSLVGTPATGMDIKVNRTQIAVQSAIAHTPTLSRSIATKAAEKQRYRSKRGDWWGKIARENHSKKRCSRLQWKQAWKGWLKSLRATEEGVNKEETFNALADAFTLNSEVKGLFLKGPMENLQDFRYYFAEKEEIETFVAATHGADTGHSSAG